MDNKQRVILTIKGHVQGVFFRNETKKKAISLELIGWVRNNTDGTVSCVAEGTKEKLEELIKWAHQGSRQSSVDTVKIKWDYFVGEFSAFGIIK